MVERARPGSWAMASLVERLSDPRRIHPLYIFGGGLSVVIPVWLLFFYH
jgi:hypothetical protein